MRRRGCTSRTNGGTSKGVLPSVERAQCSMHATTRMRETQNVAMRNADAGKEPRQLPPFDRLANATDSAKCNLASGLPMKVATAGIAAAVPNLKKILTLMESVWVL